MTTFTLNNGHTFMKKDNGYCYAIVKNTKTRIALPVFNANYEQFVKEENERQNAVNEFTNIDPIVERKAHEQELEDALREAEQNLNRAVMGGDKEEISRANDEWVKARAEWDNRSLDAAAENPEITAEQFCKMIQQGEEAVTTEEIERTQLDMAMEKLGYYPIDSEWGDIRYSTCDGQSKVMAWNTMEEGLAWANAMLDTEVKEPEPVNYCRHPEGTDLQKPAVLNQYGCVDCSKCNVQNCVHRDCMRRNPTSEGGLAECPRLKVKAEEPKQPKAKKERKSRKSKDIAYDGNGVTLTAKQVDFIKHLSDTCFWERGLDSCIWCDVLADEISGQFAGKPMTTGAMLSTICEKGLGSRCKDRINGRKCTSFALTELGKIVAAELGLH